MVLLKRLSLFLLLAGLCLFNIENVYAGSASINASINDDAIVSVSGSIDFACEIRGHGVSMTFPTGQGISIGTGWGMSSFSYTYNLGCAMSGTYLLHVLGAGSDQRDANGNCIGSVIAEAMTSVTIPDVTPQLSLSVPSQVKGLETITLTYGFPYTNPTSCPRVVDASLDNSIGLIGGTVDKYGSVSATHDFSNLSVGVHYIKAEACSGISCTRIVKYIYKKPDDKDKECKKNVGGPVNVATGNMRY